jgi:DNA-binding NarL/FixJ family response regulator
MSRSQPPHPVTDTRALPPTRPARLLIADRRPIAIGGLAAAFAETGDLVVRARCHEVGGLSAVLGLRGSIDAVVIDAGMFEGDALLTVHAVRQLDPGLAVLLLTTSVDAPLLEALAHDAVSCVSAYGDAQAIVSALRALLSGQTLLPPEVQRALTAMLRRPPPPPGTRLTPREEQVLELAATGLTICQIALRLHVSHSTAKTHLLRVYEKLDAPNRSAAVATAVARGMVRVSTTTA